MDPATIQHLSRFVARALIVAITIVTWVVPSNAEPVEPQNLFDRVEYVWPNQSGPHYGGIDSAERRRPGVYHSQVGSFDLRDGSPVLPRQLQAVAALDRLDRQYFVLLLDTGELDRDGWRSIVDGITELGGAIVQDVSVAGFVVRLNPAAYEFLRGRPGVAALEPHHPGFKLSPDIGRVPLADEAAARSGTYELAVHLFPGESSKRVAAFVNEAGGEIVGASDGWLHVRLHRDRLAALAAFESVWRVFEYIPPTLQGEEVSSTMQIGEWLEGTKPYHAAGIDGSGNGLPGTAPQALMVLDSGYQLDGGELSDTMTSAGTPGPSHRKVRHYGTTAPWGGSGDLLGCEPGTHGQLSASVALGAASTVPPEYGPPWPDWKTRKIDGVAPGAVMAGYDAALECNPVFLPGSIYVAPGSGSMPHAHDNFDARIYNFSWGAAGNTYSTYSVQVDDFLHDRQDAMVFVSAGNLGPADETILSPANAKNSVSIGATHSGPSDLLDQNDRWPPSSKGPAASKDRVGPLLMAPGSDVQSDNAWEIYYCGGTDNDQADPVECMVFEGSSGTSEASPAAAGAALLVRDYFQQGFHRDGTASDPGNESDQVNDISGALVKALLIASADWVGEGNTPGSALSVLYRFNNEQGYGRIQLDNVLKLSTWPGSPAGLIVHDAGLVGGVSDMPLLGQSIDAVFGETQVQSFDVLDPSQELRVALTWMEDSGDILFNDLNLVLQSPDPDGPGPLEPIVYYGNYFTDDNDRDGLLDPGEDCPGIDGSVGTLDPSPWSLPACPAAVRDVKHTTEAVFLSPDADADGDLDADFNQVMTGTWLLAVIAAPGGTDTDQRFAVSLSGGITIDGTIYWTGDAFDCAGSAGFTVLEVDAADDPASGLTPAVVAGRITVRVLDADTLELLDEETGFPMAQPEAGILRFESGPLGLAPSLDATPGNGLIEIHDGQLLVAVYADETNGVPDADRERSSTASTVCGFTTPGQSRDVVVRSMLPNGALRIEYAPACAAEDHTVVFGPLDQVASYAYTGQACGIGASGIAIFDPGPVSSFFLVVGNDGADTEGSYGTNSAGEERPEDPNDPVCSFTRDLEFSCD